MERNFKKRFRGMALAATLATVGCNPSVVNGLGTKDLTRAVVLLVGGYMLIKAKGLMNWLIFSERDLRDTNSLLYKKLKDKRVSKNTFEKMKENQLIADAIKDGALKENQEDLLTYLDIVLRNKEKFTCAQLTALSDDVHDVLAADDLLKLQIPILRRVDLIKN